MQNGKRWPIPRCDLRRRRRRERSATPHRAQQSDSRQRLRRRATSQPCCCCCDVGPTHRALEQEQQLPLGVVLPVWRLQPLQQPSLLLLALHPEVRCGWGGPCVWLPQVKLLRPCPPWPTHPRAAQSPEGHPPWGSSCSWGSLERRARRPPCRRQPGRRRLGAARHEWGRRGAGRADGGLHTLERVGGWLCTQEEARRVCSGRASSYHHGCPPDAISRGRRCPLPKRLPSTRRPPWAPFSLLILVCTRMLGPGQAAKSEGW